LCLIVICLSHCHLRLNVCGVVTTYISHYHVTYRSSIFTAGLIAILYTFKHVSLTIVHSNYLQIIPRYLLLFRYLSRLCKYIYITPYFLPVSVAARSKAWICGCLLVGIVGSNPVGGHECQHVVSIVCCTGRGLCDGPIARPGESY
jgi:hypothetical protein